jgi:hypothetical protein
MGYSTVRSASSLGTIQCVILMTLRRRQKAPVAPILVRITPLVPILRLSVPRVISLECPRSNLPIVSVISRFMDAVERANAERQKRWCVCPHPLMSHPIFT